MNRSTSAALRRLVEILARLDPDDGVAVVRDGARWVVGVSPREITIARGEDAFAALDRLEAGGWWAGMLGYDLGRTVESVRAQAADDRHLPDLCFARYDARVEIGPDGDAAVVGTGAARPTLEAAVAGSAPARDLPAPRLGRMTSSLSRHDHARAVAHIHDAIRAGDCYQVNLTRRLHAPATGAPVDPTAMFCALLGSSAPPYAALLTFGAPVPGFAVVSASPELFLERDGPTLTTRPIKGTDADPERLTQSAKDAAEHVMIVDLARNDLGRVCVPGSVQVPALMALEAHPGVFHLVSTVTGELRPGLGLRDAVRALFPAASITGAPKPNVMQIIEHLEPHRRGVYCGAVGFVDAQRRRACLNVAIRTFTVTPVGVDFGVGGGVVMDSTAAGEWDESELKARKLLARLGASSDAAAPIGSS